LFEGLNRKSTDMFLKTHFFNYLGFCCFDFGTNWIKLGFERATSLLTSGHSNKDFTNRIEQTTSCQGSINGKLYQSSGASIKTLTGGLFWNKSGHSWIQIRNRVLRRLNAGLFGRTGRLFWDKVWCCCIYRGTFVPFRLKIWLSRNLER